jgi:hypothetical protein
MIRKLMLGAAALALAGSLATAGEVVGIRLEAGLEIGHQAVKLFDDEVDYSTLAYQPYVQVSRFGMGPCFSLRIRALFAVDEDTEIEGLDATMKTSGYDIQALGGFGIEVGAVKVAPVGGLSWRNLSVEADGDASGDYDFDTLILEVGARVEASLGKVTITGQLTVGPVVTGEVEVDIDGLGSDTADIDFFDGYQLELRVGVDIKLTDFVGMHAGLTYERFADSTQEFKDLDLDSDDELNRIMAHVGVIFTF